MVRLDMPDLCGNETAPKAADSLFQERNTNLFGFDLLLRV